MYICLYIIYIYIRILKNRKPGLLRRWLCMCIHTCIPISISESWTTENLDRCECGLGIYVYINIQPNAGRLAQNLGIISNNFYFSTRRTRILMRFVITPLLLPGSIRKSHGQYSGTASQSLRVLKILYQRICIRLYLELYQNLGKRKLRLLRMSGSVDIYMYYIFVYIYIVYIEIDIDISIHYILVYI